MAKRIILKKDELIGKIAEVSAETKATTGKIVDAYPQVVVSELQKNPPKGDEIVCAPLPGFGAIAVKNVPERKIKNNITGKEQIVPAHRAVAIKATKTIKVALNPEAVKKSADEKSAKKTAKKA